MEYTTVLTDDEFDEPLVWLRDWGLRGSSPILGPSGSLRAFLIQLHHITLCRRRSESSRTRASPLFRGSSRP